MKFKQFKIGVFSLLITSVVSAQEYDKKFSESFKTNQDVAININASNADIEVTTWDKNEVSVTAVITVEGLEKKEAQKYLDSWEFEALGNKDKVQINANKTKANLVGDNFIFYNSSSNYFPKGNDFEHAEEIGLMPEITEMPEIPEIPEIEIPEIDFEEVVTGLEDVEFDFDKYEKDGGNYFFQWKDGVNDITIKSKKEWEAFKKSDKYKVFKKQQEERKKAIKKELERFKEERINRAELQRKVAKARAEAQRANREEIRKELARVRKKMTKSRKEMLESRKELYKKSVRYSFNTHRNNFTVDGKKIKITKKIIVKVPKSATFNLKTKHCKVTLPKTKVSGKVSYGTLKVDTINGGSLKVLSASVDINSLNACTLFLNNVTDANLVSVTNSTLNFNSSKVLIQNLYKDMVLNADFGNLTIAKIHPNPNTLRMFLNYTDAEINAVSIQKNLQYNIGKKLPELPSKPSLQFTLEKLEKEVNGDFTVFSKDKKVFLKGKYSQLKFKTK